jgi:hypothetical protein
MSIAECEARIQSLVNQLRDAQFELARLRENKYHMCEGFTLDNPSPEVANRMAERLLEFLPAGNTGIVAEMYAEEVFGPDFGGEHVKTLPQRVLDRLHELDPLRRFLNLDEGITFDVSGTSELYASDADPLSPQMDPDSCATQATAPFMPIVPCGEAYACAEDPEYWGCFGLETVIIKEDNGVRQHVHRSGYSPFGLDTTEGKVAIVIARAQKRKSPTPEPKKATKKQKPL